MHGRDALIGIDAASEYLGCRKSWLYQSWRLESVPAYRVGKALRLRRSELDAWLLTRRANRDLQGVA